MGKLVSLVIPCFNVEKYINRCLTSIVNQTIGIENLEVIVIDDASYDSTWNILLEWEQKYPDNFVLIQHEKNKKQGAARNTGLCYVTSPYISFIDADDWIESTMLELMYTKITAMNLDAIGCGYHRAVSDNDTIKEKTGKGFFYDYSSELQKRKLVLHGCPGYVSGKLYRTSLMQEYQIFFPEQCYYEDIDWKDQFSLHLTRYYELEDKLYYYFVNPQSTTMQSTCDRHFDRFLVELNRLERYKKLELFEKYKSELEFHFIKVFYLNTLYIFLSRCNDFTPKILSYMQSTLKTEFPNYTKNCYLESELTKLEQYLLRTVEMDLSQSELNQLTNSLRKDIGVEKVE